MKDTYTQFSSLSEVSLSYQVRQKNKSDAGIEKYQSLPGVERLAAYYNALSEMRNKKMPEEE